MGFTHLRARPCVIDVLSLVNFNAFFPLDEETNEHVDVQDDHFEIVRQIGAAGAVLLKNTGSLPLSKPRSLILIGTSRSYVLQTCRNRYLLQATMRVLRLWALMDSRITVAMTVS